MEVWSDDLQRWLHCDPCENVIDTPLMYDKVNFLANLLSSYIKTISFMSDSRAGARNIHMCLLMQRIMCAMSLGDIASITPPPLNVESCVANRFFAIFSTYFWYFFISMSSRFLQKLNNRLSKNLPAERQKWLASIFMKELVEFLSPQNQLRDGSEAENHGRKSGAESWRKERGELGPANFCHNNSPVIIKPSEKEIRAKCFL